MIRKGCKARAGSMIRESAGSVAVRIGKRDWSVDIVRKDGGVSVRTALSMTVAID